MILTAYSCLAYHGWYRERLYQGNRRIFQESKIGDHTNNMSVVGIAPWGMVTGRDDIAKHGIGVSKKVQN